MVVKYFASTNANLTVEAILMHAGNSRIANNFKIVSISKTNRLKIVQDLYEYLFDNDLIIDIRSIEVNADY